MTHTPGPWHRNIPPAAKYATIFAGRNTHVCVLTHTNKDVEGNADLIAAAPDMAEALQAALRHIPNEAMEYSEGDHGDRVYIADLVRAALAKAGL